MKYQLKLTHLPTDKIWLTIEQDCTEEDIETLEGFCKEIAEGEATYLELNCPEGRVYFTKKILSESVITIIIS